MFACKNYICDDFIYVKYFILALQMYIKILLNKVGFVENKQHLFSLNYCFT